MVIHDRNYSRWMGDRAAPVQAATAIFQAGIRRGAATIFRRKVPAVLLVLASFGPFILCFGAILVLSYIRGNAAQYPELAGELVDEPWATLLRFSPEWIYSYMFLFQWPLVIVACIVIGAGLIAEDRRANALEMYLSRPVSVRQYLLGKLAVIGFYVALVTIFPAALLVLTQLTVSWAEPGEILRLTGLLVRTVAGGAVWVLLPSLTVLTASSLADRARNAAILWLGVVLMLEFVVSNILREVFNVDAFLLLQLGFNIRQVLNYVLDNQVDLVTTVPVWQSGLVLLLWVVACVRVLHARVKPVEVVA